MRTTLDIAEDVLQAAKELAAREGSTAGKVLSDLARKALQPVRTGKIKTRNGVPVFPATGEVVTLEQIQQIADPERRLIRALFDVQLLDRNATKIICSRNVAVW